ncbi:MAG TPA: J domain-containing protein [Polyangiaceae bacterium]|nr:J domain-containing protein [Polyangiaceae bacterium]
MARRRQVPAGSLPHGEASSSTGLRLHASGDRLSALLAERERLLVQVRKRRAALQAAAERAESAARDMTTHVAPLKAKFDRAREEIAALFDELLAPGRLAPRTRKKVLGLHRSLVAQGLLEPREDETNDDPSESQDPFGDYVEIGAPVYFDEEPEVRVPPAAQHGQSAGRETLRALFRRLALALHPDRTQREDDRQRRTEAMKEATRAYEDGDLARLLELEKAWQHGSVAPASANDEGRRCEELERTIHELTLQSRELNRELRDLKRYMREELLDVSPQTVVALAKDELTELETIRDFVKAFRDGKITLSQFLEGPRPAGADMSPLEALVYDMVEEETRAGRPRSKSRRRRA